MLKINSDPLNAVSYSISLLALYCSSFPKPVGAKFHVQITAQIQKLTNLELGIPESGIF